MTRMENGVTKSDGLCLQCAKELGIKPVDDILKNMGINEDELERMDSEMQNLASDFPDGENGDGIIPTDNPDESDGTAPSIDLIKIYGGNPRANSEKEQ